jgi:hypothetical protein
MEVEGAFGRLSARKGGLCVGEERAFFHGESGRTRVRVVRRCLILHPTNLSTNLLFRKS